jgi:hypothetical protein
MMEQYFDISLIPKLSQMSKNKNKRMLQLKLNTFANFETPAKIDLSELFFGRLKGHVDFFCHFLLSEIIQ